MIQRLCIAAILMVTMSAPAWALPSTVTIRGGQFSELEQQMRAIEADLRAQGVPNAQGVTLRLQNYIEDVVILAGRSTQFSPEAIASAAAEELRKGTDKRAVGSKLVDMYKSNKFSS